MTISYRGTGRNLKAAPLGFFFWYASRMAVPHKELHEPQALPSVSSKEKTE
jgi:hypothetical protein